MKTVFSVVALCLVLSYLVSTEAARLDRSLKQSEGENPGADASVSGSAICKVHDGACNARASVSTKAINDAAKSIAKALSTAVAEADGDADADASSFAFAQAIAEAFATIISSHVLSVYTTPGGQACAYTYSNAASFAISMSTATTSAFARSSNAYAKAAGACFAQAVVSASTKALQQLNYNVCTTYGYDYIYERIETVGYVQTIATAFSSVFTSVRNKDLALATALCSASGTSTTSVTTSG